MQRARIYLASPLFSAAERRENLILANAMQPWCDVFLPQRDGDLLPNLIADGMHPDIAYVRVFRKDVAALEACDAILVNLDGRAVDEGAAFELGYAYARGKICVGYHTDPRVLLPSGLNPMVTVPLTRILSSAADVQEWSQSLRVDHHDSRVFAR